ncbi:MAG: ankyrin repeat protein 17 isoform [Chthonomonadales bacterium]|nr:ankyrin repeat protein 17 isoform [Chthonomonadales bacterium]
MCRRLFIVVAALLSALCLGCSGRNVQNLIHANTLYSWWHAAFFSLVALISAVVCKLSRHKPAYPMMFLLLLICHPACWQSNSGDCGFGKADNSFNLSVFGVLLLLAQLIHLSPPKVRWGIVTTLGGLVLVPLIIIGCRPEPVQSVAERKLLNAAAIGDLSQVRSLVLQGADVNVTRRSEPPTRWEPLENAWTKLRWPDYPIQRGYTPLMLACIGGYSSTVEFLVDHGADVNATEHDGGSSARTFALEYGHPSIVPLLIHHGTIPTPTPNAR